MVMPYTYWVCLSVFIEIYNLLRGMLNKFMTRLYHTKTILYIIIIGLEAQPPANIILLLHRQETFNFDLYYSSNKKIGEPPTKLGGQTKLINFIPESIVPNTVECFFHI